MRVCILGGGGNVAEATGSVLYANGHNVFLFRFPTQIPVPGTPIRPERSRIRLSEINIKRVFQDAHDLPMYKPTWIGLNQFKEVDAFVFAFPTYMAEPVAALIGKHMAGRPLIALSDRFLGSYAFLTNVRYLHGDNAMPSIAIAFNGVPVMAQKETRDAPVSVFYIKPRHSFACYPHKQQNEARIILNNLFGLKSENLIGYESMLHLAFENTHCIEHAVVDLYNLQRNRYIAGKKLYSQELYKPEVLKRIDDVASDRDKISQMVLGKRFASLKEYDLRVFGDFGSPGFDLAGTSEFRTLHSALSKAPSPESWGAFGYEDTGWSMVTLESFGKAFNLSTPSLSKLIDDWNRYSGCDYREAGRTASSLMLSNLQDKTKEVRTYSDFKWIPHSVPTPNGLLR